MRISETLLFLVLFAIFTSVTGLNISEYKKISEINKLELEKKDSLEFISQSFINTCNGSGFESFNQWQKTCRALWNLDYIGWSKADAFMIDDCKNTASLYYASWRTGVETNEIYCRSIYENACDKNN